MTRSISLRWNKSNLIDLFSSNKIDKPLHLHLPSLIALSIPGMDPSVTKKTKQLICDSDCYTHKVLLAELWCMILSISSPGDNPEMCDNLCAKHNGI